MKDAHREIVWWVGFALMMLPLVGAVVLIVYDCGCGWFK